MLRREQGRCGRRRRRRLVNIARPTAVVVVLDLSWIAEANRDNAGVRASFGRRVLPDGGERRWRGSAAARRTAVGGEWNGRGMSGIRRIDARVVALDSFGPADDDRDNRGVRTTPGGRDIPEDHSARWAVWWEREPGRPFRGRGRRNIASPPRNLGDIIANVFR